MERREREQEKLRKRRKAIYEDGLQNQEKEKARLKRNRKAREAYAKRKQINGKGRL